MRLTLGVTIATATTLVVGAVAVFSAPEPGVTAVPRAGADHPVELVAEANEVPDASLPPSVASSPPTAPDSPSPVATPSVDPIFDAFVYREDPFLPRPAGDEEVLEQALPEFVDDRGGELLAIPVQGRRSSEFGMRFHPILRYWKLHTGLDFAASCGTPIGAAADGRVTFVGWAGGNGRMVSVDHGEIAGHRVRTNYAHLSSAGVRVGQEVERHQAIGRVGTTGYSTGCHLHFEVLADGQFTNPSNWLSGGPIVVHTDDMLDVAAPSPDASLSPSPSPSPSIEESGSPSPSDAATPPGTTPPGTSTSPSPSPSPSKQPTTPGPSPSTPQPSPTPVEPTQQPTTSSPTPEQPPSPEASTPEPQTSVTSSKSVPPPASPTEDAPAETSPSTQTASTTQSAPSQDGATTDD